MQLIGRCEWWVSLACAVYSRGNAGPATAWRHTRAGARTTTHWNTVGFHLSIHLTVPFNGPSSGTARVSRYQKGKTNLDFTNARDSEWQWHQLGHMQVCTSLQTDNDASIPPLKFFYRPDALPAAQPTASKHCLHLTVAVVITDRL